MISEQMVQPRPNKGFTMDSITERVKRILELASGFADLVDSFDDLEDELFGTDFCVYFGFAEDFSPDFPPDNWYVSIDNVIDQSSRLFDVTADVEKLD